jgi:membrane protein DedA with SNARE-associated domain
LSVFASIATWLEHFHGPVVYALCGAFVFGEAAVLLGFVIPGETAALVGGALASLHDANLVVMLAVIVACAIGGDSTGYEIGKYLGPWLLERRLLRDNLGVHKARRLIVRFGGPAVFLGRWVALARAMVPGLTGMSGMRYRTFLAYNAAGGIVWGSTFVLLGYTIGKKFQSVLSTASTASYIVVGVAVVVVVGYLVFRKLWERRERRALSASGELHGQPHANTDKAGEAAPGWSNADMAADAANEAPRAAPRSAVDGLSSSRRQNRTR